MNVVVTGGGTIAPIDDVRHVANVSTGRLSARITEACLARGATVWHIHTPAAQLPFAREALFDLDAQDAESEVRRLTTLHQAWRHARSRLHLAPLPEGTVADYAAALERTLRDHPIDLAFLAMAVGDFEPERFPGKIDSPSEPFAISCSPTPKIIQRVRDWSPGIVLVGFKLLSGASLAELIAAAQQACVTNRAEATIANDLDTIRAGRHTIHLVRPGAAVETFADDSIAKSLVDRVLPWARELRAARNEPTLPSSSARLRAAVPSPPPTVGEG